MNFDQAYDLIIQLAQFTSFGMGLTLFWCVERTINMRHAKETINEL